MRIPDHSYNNQEQFDKEMEHSIDKVIEGEKAELRKKKYTGLRKFYYPDTKKLRQQGSFEEGLQTGPWRVIDLDGDQQYFQYDKIVVGTLCRDGTTSSATGSGACSGHGGFYKHIFESKKLFIQGTGKYRPFQDQIQDIRKQVRHRFHIQATGQQFQFQIMKKLIELADLNAKYANEKDLANEQLESKNEFKDKSSKKIQLECSHKFDGIIRVDCVQSKTQKQNDDYVVKSDEDESDEDEKVSIGKSEAIKISQSPPQKILEIQELIQDNQLKKQSKELKPTNQDLVYLLNQLGIADE